MSYLACRQRERKRENIVQKIYKDTLPWGNFKLLRDQTREPLELEPLGDSKVFCCALLSSIHAGIQTEGNRFLRLALRIVSWVIKDRKLWTLGAFTRIALYPRETARQGLAELDLCIKRAVTSWWLIGWIRWRTSLTIILMHNAVILRSWESSPISDYQITPY